MPAHSASLIIFSSSSSNSSGQEGMLPHWLDCQACGSCHSRILSWGYREKRAFVPAEISVKCQKWKQHIIIHHRWWGERKQWKLSTLPLCVANKWKKWCHSKHCDDSDDEWFKADDQTWISTARYCSLFYETYKIKSYELHCVLSGSYITVKDSWWLMRSGELTGQFLASA